MKFRLAFLYEKLYSTNEFCENLFTDSLHKGIHEFLLTLLIFLDWFQCSLAHNVTEQLHILRYIVQWKPRFTDGVHIVMQVYTLFVQYRQNSAQWLHVLWKLTQWKPCLTGCNLSEWRLKYRRSVFMYDVLFPSHLNFCVWFTKNINIIWNKQD